MPRRSDRAPACNRRKPPTLRRRIRCALARNRECDPPDAAKPARRPAPRTRHSRAPGWQPHRRPAPAAELRRVALVERAKAAVGTLGVAVRPGSLPNTGVPTFEIGDDEIEVGMGLHGE